MYRKSIVLAAALAIGLFTAESHAQNSFNNRTVGGGVGGSAAQGNVGAGFNQTGQLQSSAAVDRTGFVGGGGAANQVGRNTAVGGGRQAVGGLGGGGLGGLGGGLGGFGGGLGGFGGGFGGGGFGGGGFGGGGFGGRGGQGFNQGGQQGGFGQGQGGQQQRTIRAGIKLGFRYTSAISKTASKFQERLNHIPRFSKNTGVKVSSEGKTMILQGTVPTEEDRLLAAKLARLEPGVYAVKNELQVVARPPIPDPAK